MKCRLAGKSRGQGWQAATGEGRSRQESPRTVVIEWRDGTRERNHVDNLDGRRERHGDAAGGVVPGGRGSAGEQAGGRSRGRADRVEQAAAADLGTGARPDGRFAGRGTRQVAPGRGVAARPLHLRHPEAAGVAVMPPRVLFADTFYWIALLDPRDAFHHTVVSFNGTLGPVRMVTTDDVLSELLTYFSGMGPRWRGVAATFGRDVLADAAVDVLPAARTEFLAALTFTNPGRTRGTA